jgi:hypothetical protein
MRCGTHRDFSVSPKTTLHDFERTVPGTVQANPDPLDQRWLASAVAEWRTDRAKLPDGSEQKSNSSATSSGVLVSALEWT